MRIVARGKMYASSTARATGQVQLSDGSLKFLVVDQSSAFFAGGEKENQKNKRRLVRHTTGIAAVCSGTKPTQLTHLIWICIRTGIREAASFHYGAAVLIGLLVCLPGVLLQNLPCPSPYRLLNGSPLSYLRIRLPARERNCLGLKTAVHSSRRL
jgi:hypothetical protein